MNPSQGMAEMTAASAAGEMNQEGIGGIVMEGNCNRRRWLAHGNICRCSCRGENHSAMQPGSLTATRLKFSVGPRISSLADQRRIRVHRAILASIGSFCGDG